jgi:uncharacterized low-complexity protein
MVRKSMKPVSLAAGIALAGSLAGVSAAQADANPFGMTALSSGYMAAAVGEGRCGGDKDKDKDEGKCGEGKCGEGKCGDDKEEGEGKCGEGKCGGMA